MYDQLEEARSRTCNVINQIRRIRIRVITIGAIDVSVGCSLLVVVGVEDPEDFTKGGASVEKVVCGPGVSIRIQIIGGSTSVDVDRCLLGIGNVDKHAKCDSKQENGRKCFHLCRLQYRIGYDVKSEMHCEAA